MLQALKFVKGAVSKKDYQAELTHFLIADGHIKSYNGTIALCSPIDLDVQAAPKADTFVKAIERCDEQVVLNLTQAGRISVRSGSFRATVECTEEYDVLRSIKPEGNDVKLPSTFVQALRTVRPFIGVDASRPWAMGVLVRDKSIYATNNIIIGQHWIGEPMPNITIPASAIDALIRIGQEPTRITLSKNSATFYFGERWLRTQLLDPEWPDVDALVDKGFENANLTPLPEGFYETLDKLKPFAENADRKGCVRFTEDGLVAGHLETSGAAIAYEGLPHFGAYNYAMLKLLEGAVTKIDFTKHPKPCPFTGPGLRGVCIGMVQE